MCESVCERVGRPHTLYVARTSSSVGGAPIQTAYSSGWRGTKSVAAPSRSEMAPKHLAAGRRVCTAGGGVWGQEEEAGRRPRLLDAEKVVEVRLLAEEKRGVGVCAALLVAALHDDHAVGGGALGREHRAHEVQHPRTICRVHRPVNLEGRRAVSARVVLR